MVRMACLLSPPPKSSRVPKPWSNRSAIRSTPTTPNGCNAGPIAYAASPLRKKEPVNTKNGINPPSPLAAELRPGEGLRMRVPGPLFLRLLICAYLRPSAVKFLRYIGPRVQPAYANTLPTAFPCPSSVA